MTLDEIIERMAEDHSLHMTGGPYAEAEIVEAEARLGLSFPPPFRCFLERMGAGIYYEKHEIFGCRRVMIHDIELVPDLVSMRTRLLEDTAGLPEHRFPLHRLHDVVHLIDLSPGPAAGRVFPVRGGSAYPDLAAFLEAVVLPRSPAN